MSKTYVLAKDHLQQAQIILSVNGGETRQLRQALQVMIEFIDQRLYTVPPRPSNIIAFPDRSLPPRSG